MKFSGRLPDRRSLAELTAGIDLLAQLRQHRCRRLALDVPEGHALVWFDVFPLAGALVLVRADVPLWVCRWQLVDRVAVIGEFRAFWYEHRQALDHLPLDALLWLATRWPVRWASPSGQHFWQRCLREAHTRGLSVRSGVIGQP